MHNELRALTDKGVEISPENLKISDRATICMPYHKLLDILEEDRLGSKKIWLHTPWYRAGVCRQVYEEGPCA